MHSDAIKPSKFNWDAFARTISMLIAGLFGAALWVVFRFEDCSLLTVFGTCICAMVAYIEVRWKNKIKYAFIAAAAIGGMQFGISMLIQEKFLLLIWVFAFSYLLMRNCSSRGVSTAAIAVSGFTLVENTGYLPGINRAIAMIFGLIGVLGALAIVEYALIPLRIQIAMRNYMLCMNMHMRKAFFPKITPGNLKLEVLKCAALANALTVEEHFFFQSCRKASLKARSVIEHLHTISRALLIIENSTPEELELCKDDAAKVSAQMCRMGITLGRGLRINGAEPLEIKPVNPAAEALGIINAELLSMGGKEL